MGHALFANTNQPMKIRNALVLVVTVLLLSQIPVRRYLGESYPMIVLPSGAGVYEHKTDRRIFRVS
jgi:hypothetical protein